MDRTLSASEGQNWDAADNPAAQRDASGDVAGKTDDFIVLKVSARKSEALPEAGICSRCMLERKEMYVVRWSRFRELEECPGTWRGEKSRQ